MATLQLVELGVLGPLQVRQYGLPVSIPGAKPRAILTMLGLHGSSVVSAETLLELLWGDDPPRTAAKALPTHISALRRALGDGFVVTQGAVFGIGSGCLMIPVAWSAVQTLDSSEVAHGSTLFNVNHHMAAAIGAALMSVILTSRAKVDEPSRAYATVFVVAAILAMAITLPASFLPKRPTPVDPR